MARIIDIHTHGGFGINFNDCDFSHLEKFSQTAPKFSIVGFCPTLATDSIENIQKQLAVFSKFKAEQNSAAVKNSQKWAKMLGVHLEAIFLNPEKSGIHNKSLFLQPNIENFKKVAGDFTDTGIIKIVTLAPELDENCELTDFLISKNIKVQAGHTLAEHCYNCCATTHHFNAMPQLSHHGSSITLRTMLSDDIYAEIIADGAHVNDDMLKLFFKTKSHSKTILISDSLPLAKSDLEKTEFCGQTIFNSEGVAKNSNGTIAGSILFIEDIIKLLDKKGILSEQIARKMAWENPIEYLGLDEKTVSAMLEI